MAQSDNAPRGRNAASVELELGPLSEAGDVLLSARGRRNISLTVRGVTVSGHDRASELLEGFSNALFFQMTG